MLWLCISVPATTSPLAKPMVTLYLMIGSPALIARVGDLVAGRHAVQTLDALVGQFGAGGHIDARTTTLSLGCRRIAGPVMFLSWISIMAFTVEAG